jgi:hypothetical protein
VIAGVVNAIIVFITFLATIPGIIMPTRGWLKVSGYMITVCAGFSMIIGLYIWILTLKTKEDFSRLWVTQTSQVQDLMETKFQCCGYFNSTAPAFVTNPTCPSPAAAALARGCSTPITAFANVFMDDIFTAVFGVVGMFAANLSSLLISRLLTLCDYLGVDAVLIMATACLLKDRKEKERFRHIDEKTGALTTI